MENNIRILKIKNGEESSIEYPLGMVTSVKGEADTSEPKTGDVTITKEDIGLDNVSNIADDQKTVRNVGHKLTIGKQEYDGSNNIIVEKEDISAALGYTPAGGENLARPTSSEWSEWITPTPNYPGQGTSNPAFAYFNSDIKTGDKITLSVEVEFENVTKSESGDFLFNTQGTVDDQWLSSWVNPWNNIIRLTTPPDNGIRKFSSTISINSDTASHTKFGTGFKCDYWGSGRYRYRCIKIEPGTVTDPVWTPAPQDVLLKGEVDGRNLVLNSSANITEAYRLASYSLSEEIHVGDTVTVSIKGTLGTGKEHFTVYGTDTIETWQVGNSETDGFGPKNSDGIYTATIQWRGYNSKNIRVYAHPNIVSQTKDTTIEWIKIERGINPNPQWTPAPEDVVVRSELKKLINKIDEELGEVRFLITYSGSFSNLLPNNDATAIIVAQRVSTSDTIVLVLNRYGTTIFTKEIIKDNTMTFSTDINSGSVNILYNGSPDGVSGLAIVWFWKS